MHAIQTLDDSLPLLTTAIARNLSDDYVTLRREADAVGESRLSCGAMQALAASRGRSCFVRSLVAEEFGLHLRALSADNFRQKLLRS